MSIAKSGVKGYEYQYLATVYIALNIGLHNISSLLVEKKGSEDIFLQINNGLTQNTIEIQVKRESSTLNISKLAEWLTHFQEGITDNNLLYRLDTIDEIALFITKSRCNDDTVQFKKLVPNVAPNINVFISNEWNNDFVQAISEYSDNTTRLLSLRKNFCISQAKAFEDKKHTTEVFKRILIWEEVSDENLSLGINLLLNKAYNIPQSQTGSVLLNLIEIVKQGRDEQSNIKPLFEQFIDKNRAGAPVIDPNYKKRPEEESLFDELKSNNLLLLTGASLCGKSELAKQIASRFFIEGYNYLIAADIQTIIQFFAQNPIEDKIAILEDPWGHIEKSRESLNDWKRIENFVANLPSNHKLIITSRKEIIQDIYSIKSLNHKRLSGNSWHDLTLSDSHFLMDYWETISQNKNLPYEVVHSIENHLQTALGEEKLQIGQLQFLAATDELDLKGKTKSELEHIARMNSQEIGESIRDKNQEVAELISLLALVSTTTIGVNKRELAYILSNDESFYSKLKKGFWTSGYGKEEENYPEYATAPILSEQATRNLEYLERRFFYN